MVLNLSSWTPIDTFDEANAMLFSLYSGFQCLINNHSENYRPELAPSIKFHKLLCQARALHLPIPQAGKVFASKLICYFSCHPAAFGIWAYLPPDNITLNPANKNTDQYCLSEWHWCNSSCHYRHRVFLLPELPLLIQLPVTRF